MAHSNSTTNNKNNRNQRIAIVCVNIQTIWKSNSYHEKDMKKSLK